MPNKKQVRRLDPVSPDHRTLLHGWLSDPHVTNWWGEADQQTNLIYSRQESGEADGYVSYFQTVPTGYIQSWIPGNYSDVI